MGWNNLASGTRNQTTSSSRSRLNQLGIRSRRCTIKIFGLVLTVVGSSTLCFALLFSAGTKRARAQTTELKSSPTSMMMIPSVVPLFIQDAQFSSTLVLVNGSSLFTYADVIVADVRGHEIATGRVEFSPHSQRRVALAELLSAASSPPTTGRIEIMQSPQLKGMSIVAQLSLTYVGSGKPTYIDEEVAMPSASGSQTLRAVTNRTDGSPLVAITSLSESEQHVLVESFSGNKQRFSKSVVLAAGETLVTEAWGKRDFDGPPFDVASGDSSSQGWHEEIGIALSSDAAPGSFAAFGLAPHGEREHQSFTGIDFVDPMMVRSSTTVFAGVPVGSATLLPEGLYVPQIALANFSTKNIRATINYARTSGRGSDSKEIASLIVKAGSSRAISLEKLKGDPHLTNSFTVMSDGPPGALVATLVSTNQSETSEVSLLGKDEMCPENGGNHPWSLEDGTESTLLLFNHTDGTQRFNVSISGGDTVWQKSYELTSMQTQAISIRGLIESGAKDDRGMTLPQNATSGRLGWFTGGGPRGKGRVLQSNRDLAMARNFSCGEILYLCGGFFVPSSTSISIGSSGVVIGQANGSGCITMGSPCVTGDPVGQYNGNLWFGPSYSSNSNVRVDDTDPYLGFVSASAMNPGTAFVTTQILDRDNGCYVYAVIQVTVTPPDVTVDEVGFTGDYQITKWSDGTVIDNPDGSVPTWKRSSNPDYPVAYMKGAMPTMFAKLGISPSSPAISATIRVKNGSNEIANKTVTISGTSITVTGISTTSALENTVKTTTPTFGWEISYDGGSSWSTMGSSGPHTMHWTYATPLSPPFQDFDGTTYPPLYDLALQKACGPASGGTDLATIVSRINMQVDADTTYDPGSLLSGHPLNAYSHACLCADLANLLRGLIRSIGIDGSVLYLWGGLDSSTQRKYIVGSVGDLGLSNPTFRVIRSAHDSAPANPHFTYHAVVPVSGTLYDPSYGLSYASLVFDETANNSTPQQTSTTFPMFYTQSGWVCPH